MIEQEEVRNPFLGEIETEIVGMQHKAKVLPGEQINLEREAKNTHDRHAIRVENGQFESVGYLPRNMASWLAPLIDQGKIHLDGYVPQESKADEETSRCPVNLMVFQSENGRLLLERAEPHEELEALHQTVLHAYQDAQGYRNSELILGLARGLRPLEKQELLPETRLLLALLPRMAHELRMSQGMKTTVKFRELLGTLTIGQPTHHHNLTFFPLLWPETHEPSYTLLSTAIEAGEAVVEEVNESGSVPNLAVKNHCKRPLLIPEGEILIGAEQNRVINVTVLVAAGVKFVLPVSCVEAGRWRYKSRHFESKFCAPPSLRNKKLRAVHRNRSAGGPAASDQGEVWNEVQACLTGVSAHSETASLTVGPTAKSS
ncbi:MAG: ARPP-1 family domain-containing protein [Thermoguttaceae bacterium]